MKQNRRYALGYLLLLLLLAALLLLGIFAGSVALEPERVLAILLGREQDTPQAQILMRSRLPRVLASAILGGALSVAGFLLQTFFANPIAGPFVLGISSGAKLVVALVTIAALSRGIVLGSVAWIAAAFVGSMISMGFVLLIAGRVKSRSMLIICGVMIGYICSAITDFAVNFADDSNIVNLHNWSMGSFSGLSWANLRTMTPVIAVAMLCTLLLAKPMAAYQLGESYAANVGVRIKPFRVALILLSGLLSACVTAFAGPISFVGIAVPQLVKGLFRTAKPLVILPASFLGGAVFCLLCDMIARTVFAPTELSISSVTALLGAPVVIAVMLRRQRM